ncbi:putative Hydroxyacylglutathione hydrolase GloC [Blattamonas nauphoetae]|uniref:Hydroxyacylglutathione hydrolase GloC n=1 Tax=Blattamonas nauphoetae TaxID=2049346 RepID=A0ABQ9X4E2_9EUKA|nr:putative Hydroxyacylglutathione hydrolase GloC [Blattamonas nauphoetae]
MVLKIDSFPVGDLQANCTIVYDDESKEALIVDPGGDIPTILEKVKGLGLKVKQIYLTHGHFDHIDMTGQLEKDLGVKTSIHPADVPIYEKSPQLMMMMLRSRAPLPTMPPVATHKEGDIFKVGPHEGRVIHTPGHSPGGTCLLFDGILIAGDTLFRGNVGRTDLPGGSWETLVDSIKNKLFVLPDDTRVICGHGSDTTIGYEKRRSPIL